MIDPTKKLQFFRTEIDRKLGDLLPYPPKELDISLVEAARYSLLSSGKRLRPLLLLAAAEGYQVPIEKALVPACAIEMIHVYSLIHDDLPCMDDDDLRRGLPTLHKIYPEWQALLTGDFLLTYAFEMLSTAPFLSLEEKVELIKAYCFSSGGRGMIKGQMIDLCSQDQTIDTMTLEQMHRLKTGGLIALPLFSAAILGGAPEKDKFQLLQIGEMMGLAFQFIDDVLDQTANEQELGKPIGSDVAKKKTTAVSLFGIENARKKALDLLEMAQAQLKTLSCPLSLVEILFNQMVNRKS